MTRALALIGLWMLSAPALAGKVPRVHVDDLDATELPQDLAWDVLWQSLVVDGARVKGPRGDQLDYLGAVLSDSDGVVPASLRLEDRGQHLRRAHKGRVTGGAAASMAMGAMLIPVPVLMIPVTAAVVTTEIVGLTGAAKANRRFDHGDLAREVRLQHAFARDALADVDDAR